jgi:flagellar hook-associated protein 3 FlgL
MISDLVLFDSLAFSLDSVLNGIQENQSQLATGKRVNSPSDDPVAYGEAAVLGAQKSAIANDLALAQRIQGKLSSVDGALASASNAIDSAMSLATQGADATVNTAQMQSLASQVSALLSSIIQDANLQYAGSYVFAGNQTLTTPYSAAGAYAGDSGSNVFTFAGGATVRLSFNGQAVFGDNTSGLIGTLVSLQKALDAGDKAGTSAALSGLQTALQQVATTRAAVGSDEQTVSSLITDSNSKLTTLEAATNDLVGLDIPQAAAREQEALLQQQALVSFAQGLAHMPLINILA